MTRTLAYPALFRHLLHNWLRVALVTLLFALAGLVIAFTTPEEFITETRILPEFQAKSASGLKRFSALAELAGVNLGSVGQTEAIRPDLYPDILTSTPFLLSMLRQPVTDREKHIYPTLLALLTKEKKSLFGAGESVDYRVLLRAAPEQPVQLTRQQEDFMKAVKKRVVAEIDKQSGILVVRIKMPDPMVAASIAQFATSYLNSYVIDYRTDKVRQDLAFFSQRHAESKRRYDRALLNYSQHRDRNKYVATQTALIDDKQLEAELSVSRDLYNNLTNEYEQARLKVQEETPVMKVLDPPTVPSVRSEPKRTVTMLLYGLIGGLLGVLWVLLPVLDWAALAGFDPKTPEPPTGLNGLAEQPDRSAYAGTQPPRTHDD